MSYPYREVFDLVESRLLSYGAQHRSPEAIQAALAPFRDLPSSFSDAVLFAKLTMIVFYSGFRASTVGAKAGVIMSHFPDYETVAGYAEEDIQRILSDQRMIKNERKIRAVVKNAIAVRDVVRQHGSFQSYIDSFQPRSSVENLMSLTRDLQQRFNYLGGITVYHFLTDTGFPVLKPDRVIRRVFHRLGIINNEHDEQEAIRQGQAFAAATGHRIRYIDIIFVAYGQKQSDEFGMDKGICLDEPRCEQCTLHKHCNYYRRT